MSIHLTAAAAGLAIVLAAPVCAQGADMPAPIRMPTTSVKSPSEGWTDADRAADAVEKGTAALNAAQKAYQAAESMVDKATVTVRMPDGEQNETIDMAFGKGNDMDVKMGSLQIVAVGDSVYFVPDQPADKYLTKTISGNAHSTLGDLLPGFSLPAPDLALRQPLPGRPVADAFAMAGLEGVAVKGFREKDGMHEVLLGADGADGMVSIDPKTNFVKRVAMVFTPEGLPAEFKVGFEVNCNPVAEAPKSPIAFAAGSRKAAGKLEELFDMPEMGEAAEPEQKVKVGDKAPTAVLETLDGTKVDLGAMKGKVVVVDFWATWCGPCVKGLPVLQKFADDMKGNDKVVIHPVNVWEQKKDDALKSHVRDFWTKKNFTMTTLLDPGAEFIGAYGFQGIPACIVIGPDGTLVATHVGYSPDMADKLKADVEKALGTKK
ncbi:MAG: hypothetical protein RI990_324 [Planctomycetota bacterium]|jgi:thiol-disulfide isomerase/thioredoxin